LPFKDANGLSGVKIYSIFTSQDVRWISYERISRPAIAAIRLEKKQNLQTQAAELLLNLIF